MNIKLTMMSLLVACSFAILSVRTEDVPIEWPSNQPVNQPDYELPIVLSGREANGCPDDQIVWRNNNLTCPTMRAVCADVFPKTSETDDGTMCEGRRILHNCLCPGGSVCPFGSPSHFLYASATQRQYICQNVCQLPFCGNVGNRVAVAQTDVHGDRSFERRIYVRMSCRCPRHHVPDGTSRAVQARSSRNGVSQSTEYVCSVSENENVISDPCEA